MALYFFDTFGGNDVIDDEGENLADDEAAKCAASHIISELKPSRTTSIWAGVPFKVVVRDGDKAVVGCLVVSATVT